MTTFSLTNFRISFLAQKQFFSLLLFLSLFFSTLHSVILFAAAPDISFDEVKKRGKLVFACDMAYPPMEFEDKMGKATGFSVDFAQELSQRLSIKADFQTMSWEGILAGLEAGRFDAILCTMNITEERKKSAAFVEYLKLSQVFVSNPQKPNLKVSSEKDLEGKIVSVMADTTSYNFVTDKKEKLKIKDIKSYKSAPEAMQALKAGHAEVVVIDEPVGLDYAQKEPKNFAVTGQAMSPEPIGIAVKKNSAQLAKALNEAVTKMKNDGTMKKISEKWFGRELGTVK